MRHLLPLTALLLLLVPPISRAEIPDGKIKIGVLQDLPAPYASETGRGALAAAQIAAADFEKDHLTGDAEILLGDPTGGLQDDISQVRDWLDKDHVAAIVSSAGPLVNQQIARMVEQRHRTLMVAEAVGGSAANLCSPDVVVWGAGEDARMQALAYTFSHQNKNNWYFVGEESPAGLASLDALQAAVARVNGHIVGQTRHVVGALDFGQTVAAIDKSTADIAVLAESDGDLITAVRGLVLDRPSHAVTFAAPYAQTVDIDEAGPTTADGLVVIAPFYWNEDDETREFSRKWSDQMHDRHVTVNAAEVYAATRSFLEAAKAVHDIDAAKVGAELRRKSMPHTLFGSAMVRPDGRVVYNVNVYRVKPPSQIQRRWAYYDKIATVPGDQAFPPGACKAADKSTQAASPTPEKTAQTQDTSAEPRR